MMLFNLFITFFKIGLFSFGGGYAMLSMIQQEVVSKHAWVSAGEFINMVAISQATPGPIAINMATYVGFKVSNILGATFATLGVVMPSVIIMIIITKFFVKFKDNKYVEGAFKGLRPATVGLVAAAAVLVSAGAFIDYKSIIIFLVAFILSFKYKFDPILMIIISGVVGFIVYK
ncbi:chromate transporter [Clostridium botulinum C/D str. BKT12695]|nr:chromate transporter [Clostridium botulinum C/D str. BKT12695]